MDLFHVIEDGHAILRRRGVFKQAKIFSKGDHVYAELSRGSYVRLLSNGQTSVPDVSCLGVEGPGVGLTRTGVPQFQAPAARAA